MNKLARTSSPAA